MKRYAVVSHHADDQKLRLEKGQVLGRQPVHDLVSSYHWVRLDAGHILLYANYSVSMHETLHKHPKVSMLPHINSSKKLHQHVCKDSHKEALVCGLGLNESHTMEDLVDAVVAKHGALFAPHI